MQWLLTHGRRVNGIYLAFMGVTFMVGVASALQAPTLSLFLSREVDVRPFWVGLFYTVNALAGIVVSLWLAKRSDTQGDRRKLILFCCVMAIGNCVLFAFSRHYLTLITAGVLLSALANTTMPQLFALAREYADSSAREAVMFSSILRAQVSLAWVIGPPIAYALAMGFGFDVMYMSAAFAYVLCAAIVWFLLPSMRKVPVPVSAKLEAPRTNRRDALLLFTACTLMWGTNSLYIINMPLYIINELRLSEKLAGVMMGTAAGLEIPTMLIAGYYARRCGKRFLMRVATVAGLLFYIGMLCFHHPVVLLGLQLLNAVFIGILAGIGMLYFQDLMPGQAGSATTLYTNTTRVGWIIAGSMAGVIAEIWNYHSVFYVGLAMIVLTLWCLLRIKDV